MLGLGLLFVAAATLLPAGTARADRTPAGPPGVSDVLVFGDAASEKAHGFEGGDTKAIVGALGEPARVSLPTSPADCYGGDLSFDMKTDPVRQNYFTMKFWGSDVNGGQKALLYINGEQLGYRHWKVARRGWTSRVLRRGSLSRSSFESVEVPTPPEPQP